MTLQQTTTHYLTVLPTATNTMYLSHAVKRALSSPSPSAPAYATFGSPSPSSSMMMLVVG